MMDQFSCTLYAAAIHAPKNQVGQTGSGVWISGMRAYAAYSMLLVLTDWYLTLPSFRLNPILTQSDRLLINKMYNFANCKVTIYLAELVAQALIDELVC